MSRLVITADIHGRLSAWERVRAHLDPADTLAIAGDVFDTRYGNRSNPDFAPEAVRDAISALPNKTHLVFGNCDNEIFHPAGEPAVRFLFDGWTVFLHHGHAAPPSFGGADIVIQGHTHIPVLKANGSRIHINPGSAAFPKSGTNPTIAVISDGIARIVDIVTGNRIDSLTLPPPGKS